MQSLVAGIDEAGRGPLAGPVTAGCVILPPDFPVEMLNDSKKLSEKKRIAAEEQIKKYACWGIGVIDHTIIDEINILQATLKAMKVAFDMAVMKLPDWCKKNSVVLPDVSQMNAVVDGIFVPEINCLARSEVKADAKFPCVMAASIIAKVGRDRIMCEYDKMYPGYGYASHKGYPTPAHKEACRRLGPSPIQRLSFKY